MRLKVNQKRVHQTNDLQVEVALDRPGEELTLTLWRDGGEVEKSVRLKEFNSDELQQDSTSDP